VGTSKTSLRGAVMSRPRRRIFGPLFYSTLIVAVVVGGYSVVTRLGLWINDWYEVRVLAQTLRGGNPESRETAKLLLAARGPKVFVPILLDTVHDTSAPVRAMACRSLVSAGADPSVVIPILIAAAGDVEEEVRLEAARGLARVAEDGSLVIVSRSGSPGELAPGLRKLCVESLRRLLKDRSSQVRVEAVSALSVYGSEPAVAADLVAATGEEDRAVRLAAARGLLKVNGAGDRSAAQTLIALVCDPDAVPDRLAVMDVLKNTSQAVQDQAVAALVELLSHRDPLVLPDLIDCLSGSGIRARAVVSALEGLLNDEDPALRSKAAMAIVTIERQASPRVVDVLVRMVADPTVPQDGRESAIPFLRGANSSALTRATPDLIRQLGDGNAVVRQNALSLLSMIVDETPAEMPAPTDGR
jgi:HEAT repeat protein